VIKGVKKAGIHGLAKLFIPTTKRGGEVMARIICSIGNGIDWCGHESDGVDDSLPLCSRHRKLINEPLREQIAREILAECEKNHASPYNNIVLTHGGEPLPLLCRCAKAAAIARGEK